MNINEILYKLQLFKLLINSERLKHKIGHNTDLKNDIDSIEFLIKYDKLLKLVNNNPKEESLKDHYKEFSKISYWWPYIENFSTTEYLENPDYILKTYLKNSEIIDLLHEFFENATPKIVQNTFLKLFNNPKTYIHFINKERYANNLGEIVYLNFYKSCQITVFNKHTIEDVAVLAHEFGHGIQFFNNYNYLHTHTSKKPYVEISSTFFEMLCLDYLKKHFPRASLEIETNLLNSRLYTAKKINKELEIIKIINSINFINIDDLDFKINYFKTFYDDKEEIVNILNQKNDLYYIYTTSFIIACNLFMIYLIDPEHAFYLLYKIFNINLKIGPNEYFKEIKNLDLIKSERINEYRLHLKRKLEKN